jgi:hypothetical protein
MDSIKFRIIEEKEIQNRINLIQEELSKIRQNHKEIIENNLKLKN